MPTVKPSCRYDHGPLERVDGVWSVQEMKALEPALQKIALAKFGPTRQQFVFSMYRCKTCGYLEMFDDEDSA